MATPLTLSIRSGDAERSPALVFVGFMGAGKSTAAARAAEALHASAVDVDSAIEERLGKPLARVFTEDGEGAFRAAEEQVTLELLESPGAQVLALGGGAVLHRRVRETLRRHLVIWLDVRLEEAWKRCGASGRPLASEKSDFARLYAEREPLYMAVADAIVPAEGASAIGEVLGALDAASSLDRRSGEMKMLWATTASGDHPAYIGPGLLRERRLWGPVAEARRFLVTDRNVGPQYGEALEPLEGQVSVSPGEQSKTVAQAEVVWGELARAGMTRQDLLVALGGGVVGDLAGFCAATYQRGVPLLQVPTSLVAQVDSAYGGKTAVNLPQAKNYVGAYHQPAAVVADTGTLATLPAPELAAGYAEVVKTALIAGGALWRAVRSGADPASTEVIAGCARTKLRIVAQDERDAGARQVLNLGHTVGHAIEAVGGYARYRHGEAVALGLLAALALSERHGLREEVRELLRSHGLPVTLQGLDPEEVATATSLDKKRRGPGPVPFVLLEEPGAPKTGCEVQRGAVLAAVRELTRQ